MQKEGMLLLSLFPVNINKDSTRLLAKITQTLQQKENH